MSKTALFLILFAPGVFGQNCIKYGAQTILTGALVLVDEEGYNQFIALKLAGAICTVADPKDVKEPADPYYRKQRAIREVQAGVYGSDAESNALRDRVNRLVGQRVVITGDMSPASTGYDRTNVALRVRSVEPADPAGQRALLAPNAEIKIKDVDAYDVVIKAGKRLVIQAYESGIKTPLLPSNQYLTHWMTGGEVVYVYCRDGYERNLISNSEKGGGICFDGDELCGLSAFPKTPVTIKLRCTKKR